MRHVIIFLFAALLEFPLMAQEEVCFKDSSITSFEFGTAKVALYPVLGNDQRPLELRQFRYDPLFVPDRGKDGELDVTVVPNGAGWSVLHYLRLSLPETDDLAVRRLNELYPGSAKQFSHGNVSVIKPTSLQVEIGFPANLGGSKSVSMNVGINDFVKVVINTDKEETAKSMRDWLKGPLGSETVAYRFKARKAAANSFVLTMKGLANTSIYNKLNNPDLPPNNGKVFVRRDDLRNLCDRLSLEASSNATIESPERFNEESFNGLLKLWNRKEELEFSDYGKERWRSTYNAADLAPDVVTKQLNDTFARSEGKDEWKVNKTDAKSGEAGGAYGLISGHVNAQMASTYSEQELSKYLEARGLKCEFQGNKIVPKSLYVQEINRSDFTSEIRLASSRVYVGESYDYEKTQDIDLAPGKAGEESHLSFRGQLSELDQNLRKIRESIVSASTEDGSSGYLLVGDLQICWGVLSPVIKNDPRGFTQFDDAKVCAYGVVYTKPFAATPTLMTAVRTSSNAKGNVGYVMFNSNEDAAKCFCAYIPVPDLAHVKDGNHKGEHDNKPNGTNKIEAVRFVAIGKIAK